MTFASSTLLSKESELLLNQMRPCQIKLTRCNVLKETLLRRSGRTTTSSKTSAQNVNQSMTKVETQKNNSLSIITPTQMSSILWRSLTVQGFEIKVGMIICAKMSTFWPWPAQVIGLLKKKARVKFFGDFRVGSVDKTACVPFYNCHTIVFNYVNTIDDKTKENFKQNVIDNLSQPRRAIHRIFPLK